MEFRDLFPGHGSIDRNGRIQSANGASHLADTTFALGYRKLLEIFNGLFNGACGTPRAIGRPAVIKSNGGALRPEWERCAGPFRHDENHEGNAILAGKGICCACIVSPTIV